MYLQKRKSVRLLALAVVMLMLPMLFAAPVADAAKLKPGEYDPYAPSIDSAYFEINMKDPNLPLIADLYYVASDKDETTVPMLIRQTPPVDGNAYASEATILNAKTRDREGLYPKYKKMTGNLIESVKNLPTGDYAMYFDLTGDSTWVQFYYIRVCDGTIIDISSKARFLTYKLYHSELRIMEYGDSAGSVYLQTKLTAARDKTNIKVSALLERMDGGNGSYEIVLAQSGFSYYGYFGSEALTLPDGAYFVYGKFYGQKVRFPQCVVIKGGEYAGLINISDFIGFESSYDAVVYSDTDGAEIDLIEETITLPDDFTPAKFSVNGGGKWTAYKSNSLNIPKLLDKELTLWLSDANDQTIKFPKINARPKFDLQINYRALHMKDGALNFAMDDENFWTLTKKNTDEITIKGIEISRPSAAKKSVSDENWCIMPDIGIAVAGLIEQTDRYGNAKEDKFGNMIPKSVSNTYFVRYAAVADDETQTYIPRSKPAKITAKGKSVPKNVSVNYTKEEIKFAAGMVYYINGDPTMVTKDSTVLSVSSWIDDCAGFDYFLAPTAKAPASGFVRVELARREDPMLYAEYGKIILEENQAKFVQYSTDGGKKWGSFKPNGAQTGDVLVRLKSSAKANNYMMYEGYDEFVREDMFELGRTDEIQRFATGYTYKLKYEWGEYEDSNGRTKQGLVDCWIE